MPFSLKKNCNSKCITQTETILPIATDTILGISKFPSDSTDENSGLIVTSGAVGLNLYAGSVLINGTPIKIFNKNVTVENTSTGIYTITFSVPQSSTDYPVFLTTQTSGIALVADDYLISYNTRTVNSVTVCIREQDNGPNQGVLVNNPYSFMIPKI